MMQFDFSNNNGLMVTVYRLLSSSLYDIANVSIKNETQVVLAILVKNFWKNTTNNKGII